MSGWAFRRLIMIFAGSVAQRRYDPHSHVQYCATFDFIDADNLAHVMCWSKEAVPPIIMWAQLEAEALITRSWHLVEALAGALLKSTTLDSEAAIEVLLAAEHAYQMRFGMVRTSKRACDCA